jgi:hypothetical protein
MNHAVQTDFAYHQALLAAAAATDRSDAVHNRADKRVAPSLNCRSALRSRRSPVRG